MRIHVIAVSGAGMGPLAGLLASLGHEVSGSDVAFDPPIGPRLEQWGIRCVPGFSPKNLEPAPDLVVVGNLCRADNPEARAAIDRGLPYTHIAGALARFALQGTQPFVVTGTHGKTTTSAVLAGLLQALGQNPGYFIGGVPVGLSDSFRPATLPSSPGAPAPPFVLEGDEYDTAFFEKTAKFLHYGAQVVVLTSLEHDHIDIYPSMEDYRRPFAQLLRGLPERGLVVAWSGSEEVVRVVQDNARCRVAWYALRDDPRTDARPGWEASVSAKQEESATRFELSVDGVPLGELSTPLMGAHNVRNCLAAMAAVSHARGFEPEQLSAPLASARGVQRRQQLLFDEGGIIAYDDFAHHPTAVLETLKAVRLRHAKRRLIAVFEPRSATACSPLHQQLYPAAFEAADRVLLAPVGRALPASARLDTQLLASAISSRGPRATAHQSTQEILQTLAEEARAGDVVVILSNGRFDGIPQRLRDQLARGNGRS